MKETKFQTVLKKKLVDAGAVVFNIHGHGMQAPGWPDLQVYSKIWTGHLELKVGKNKTSTAQGIIIRRLREQGVKVYVLRLDGDTISADGDTEHRNSLQEFGEVLLHWLPFLDSVI